MTGGIWGLLGGIGLFLFGMEVMTAALRDMAGRRLRRVLARFTATPVKGTLTGAAATAVVQSSTAVTVMTIGFVSAGVLGFKQALGILYGANIGTTMTGWIVMLAGVKLQIGTVALPALFVAALLGILGEGQAGRAGRFLAGFCILFIGLDMMQAAMVGIEGWITPDRLPGDGWGGRLLLVLMGLVLTVILQSSSAGVALALVLLGSGALSFAQAAALVIGMNVGTTATGLLAAMGGGRAARMTALANTIFNGVTAVVAFVLLDAAGPLLHGTGLGQDDQTALVLFHTGFNVMGAALFLPLTGAFAAAVERLVPARAPQLAGALDPRLMADPQTALDAAARTADGVSRAAAQALLAALGPARDLRPLAALRAQADPAMAALEDWLTRLRLPADDARAQARRAALMHLTDHLSRLLVRAAEADRIATIADEPALRRPGAALARAMAAMAGPAQMGRLADMVQARARRHRRATLLAEHAGILTVAEVFRQTDAMRWLERVADHAERIAHYADAARADPARD